MIIPTYNECENIEAIIDAVLNVGIDADVLVVDDGSPDGTADLVLSKATQHPGKVHLLSRTNKDGLGRAYIAGFRWGLEKGYKYFFELASLILFSSNPKIL